MKRDLTPEEARDDEIRARTEKHFNAQLARLCMGDQQLVASVDDDLSHKLAERETMAQLIVLAVTDARQAGEKLAGLIREVVRTEAEVAAIKEVEQLEQEREQEAHEDRVSVAMHE